MEDGKKKAIMIVGAVACLVLAALIMRRHTSGGGPGIESFRGQGIWVKCKSCGAEYQIDASSKEFVGFNRLGQCPEIMI